MSLTFLVLSNNTEASNELRTVLSSGPNTRLLAECNTHDRLMADLSLLRPSAIIVVLSQENPEKEFTLIKNVIASHPQTAVITASADSSATLILRSMRSGAHEFLPLPVVADEFRTVVDRIKELRLQDDSTTKK